MKLPAKVIIAILVVFAVASGALWNQSCSSGPKVAKLSAHDMQLVFQEMLPASKQQEIAASPDEKKKLVAELIKMTPEQTAKFWPVYDNYEAERKALGKKS